LPVHARSDEAAQLLDMVAFSAVLPV